MKHLHFTHAELLQLMAGISERIEYIDERDDDPAAALAAARSARDKLAIAIEAATPAESD